MEYKAKKSRKKNEKGLYQKIENPFVIKEMYERQSEEKREVMLIEEINKDKNKDRQEFFILEWFDNREYCFRKIWLSLKPKRNSDTYRKVNAGNGKYPEKRDLEKDYKEVAQIFKKALKTDL